MAQSAEECVSPTDERNTPPWLGRIFVRMHGRGFAAAPSHRRYLPAIGWIRELAPVRGTLRCTPLEHCASTSYCQRIRDVSTPHERLVPRSCFRNPPTHENCAESRAAENSLARASNRPPHPSRGCTPRNARGEPQHDLQRAPEVTIDPPRGFRATPTCLRWPKIHHISPAPRSDDDCLWTRVPSIA